MEAIGMGDEKNATMLCCKALATYPDCVDALSMLAELKKGRVCDYLEDMRKAIEAGRLDLGAKCFKEDRGVFWGVIETRPFMRAMALLALALVKTGKPESVDEAIEIFEEMLDLNPDDNQGARDDLSGCYLAQKRYAGARALFERYPEDWLAAPEWARVLYFRALGEEDQAMTFLASARKRNTHVEAYFNGSKRRPRRRSSGYAPGGEDEAAFCAEVICKAWKAHPKSMKWLKEVGGNGN